MGQKKERDEKIVCCTEDIDAAADAASVEGAIQLLSLWACRQMKRFPADVKVVRISLRVMETYPIGAHVYLGEINTAGEKVKSTEKTRKLLAKLAVEVGGAE